jgi:hypothetical protein
MFRSILALIFLASLAGLLTACNPGDFLATPTPTLKLYLPPTQPPLPTAGPTEPPKATDTPAPPPTLAIDTGEVKKQLAQVEADTSKMRGLKAKRAVPEHFVSKEQMAYDLTQQTLKGYSKEEAKRDAMRLWLLMFIDDPTTDFLQMEVDFSSEQVLGYYDRDTKELFVRSDEATLSPASRETLAHEFTHSLQDQYHNLAKVMPENMENDQAMAVKAIIEGDATVSGLMYAYQNMNKGEFRQIFQNDEAAVPPIPGRAPVYLQEAWQFPYREGADFVFSTLSINNFSFSSIDKVFNDPPKSTEQIMHPDKYFKKPRDNPKPVKLPDLTKALGDGWKMLETDTLGEFDLQIMLRENFMETPEASAGWGGARYALYQNGDQAVAVMGSVWDTPRDSSEFEDALQQSFKIFEKHDNLWNDSRRAWGIKHSGGQIMFVSGTQRATVQKVIDTIK